jgi:hypothetical protein
VQEVVEETLVVASDFVKDGKESKEKEEQEIQL